MGTEIFGSRDNITKWLKNLQPKATKALRFQFHRQFVIGLLVAGVKIQVAIYSREGNFLGTPAGQLHKWNRTNLVFLPNKRFKASETELGFLSEGVLIYSNLIQHLTNSVSIR